MRPNVLQNLIIAGFAVIAVVLVAGTMRYIERAAPAEPPVGPTMVGEVTPPPPQTPTPSPPGVPTNFPRAADSIHVVQRGETLRRIARSYGLRPVDLAAANNLPVDAILAEGQRLRIPLGEAPAEPVMEIPIITLTPSPSPPPMTATPTPTLAPIDLPGPRTVNGIPLEDIIVMDEDTRLRIRETFALGQELGNNPTALSKLGDSTIEHPFFLARFDTGTYNLGQYAHLQDVINYYSGSFGRESVTVRRGLSTWAALNPDFTNNELCFVGESLVQCEYRLHQPSIVFVRLGTNDGTSTSFEARMREMVEFWLGSGVIPILGTKADRIDGPGNINNRILRQVAAEYDVPLWDFDLVAGTLPNRGIGSDDIHLTTFYSHDYTDPTAYERGHAMHNLTALIALDAVWREIIPPAQ